MTSKVLNLQKMEWIVCQQNSDATQDALKWSTISRFHPHLHRFHIKDCSSDSGSNKCV